MRQLPLTFSSHTHTLTWDDLARAFPGLPAEARAVLTIPDGLRADAPTLAAWAATGLERHVAEWLGKLPSLAPHRASAAHCLRARVPLLAAAAALAEGSGRPLASFLPAEPPWSPAALLARAGVPCWNALVRFGEAARLVAERAAAVAVGDAPSWPDLPAHPSFPERLAEILRELWPALPQERAGRASVRWRARPEPWCEALAALVLRECERLAAA
ncbi:MAG: hypothetical protein NZ761_07280 [Dehalococcoidia bacterium]|nr:hypothetical protein [Dehalococcoidia bacterium]